MERNLLVIGATGQTGGHTAELLLQRGHRVRALVRRIDERAQRLAGLGAELVEGDVQDLDSLAEAMRGIDALYFTYPILPGLMDATANVALAAEENGVQAIVNMSQVSPRRDSASSAARQHWVAERVLERFPAAVTRIRPTFFAQWLINMWDGSGELRFPFADGRHAPIAASDQARVIAAILEDPAPHAGRIYPLYGPVELNHYEIAERMSQALGRQVTYVPIDLDAFAAILKKRGTSPHMIQHLLAVAVDYRNGIFAGTNDLVKKIGGTDPLDVESFVAQNRAFYDSHTT
ncbi:NmrA family protein [Streptomyces bingchenggensis BCW-1]|uniref:NmrA family protein n=1 Tax=Streptomyces bingchenggensis (strain BCW-1) TaxID=749414 RepID=D7C9H2_STRBB|nr:NmrA family NAD(P)-binding protein [Streptomyces bingchenggensis]ADI12684.1 NmrA family protein [Streptomyces bingchenggensis BCW-1]